MNATTTTMTAEELASILNQTARFNDRRSAMSYASQSAYGAWVMLGDDGKFWVTRPSNCAKLERAGYEYAD